MFQRIRHDNFVSALEVFRFEESFYIILEHMPISLDHIVGTPHYPNEVQLAAILGQVSSGGHNIRKTRTNCGRYLMALPILHQKD